MLLAYFKTRLTGHKATGFLMIYSCNNNNNNNNNNNSDNF